MTDDKTPSKAYACFDQGKHLISKIAIVCLSPSEILNVPELIETYQKSKPHVVADGDLPDFYNDVLVQYRADGGFAVLSLRPEKEGIDPDSLDLKVSKFKRAVKYWWPLPDVEGEK